MKKNIVLIGMPASGKSTLGVILAKTLRMKFLDTDILVQEQSGEKLQQIIDLKGVDVFREIEEKTLLGLDKENTVISTGGSAVYYDNAMAHLKKNGLTIYLDVPLDVLKRRLYNIKTRGIALSPGETIDDIYKERKPLYEKYADIQVDAKSMSAESIIEEINNALHSAP